MHSQRPELGTKSFNTAGNLLPHLGGDSKFGFSHSLFEVETLKLLYNYLSGHVS